MSMRMDEDHGHHIGNAFKSKTMMQSVMYQEDEGEEQEDEVDCLKERLHLMRIKNAESKEKISALTQDMQTVEGEFV